MISVGIRLEAEIIIRDELLSKFKSSKISTIIGYTSAADLDNCGNIIYKESVNDKYPNTFKIIGIDSNNKSLLQVIVNPNIHDYVYTISLSEINNMFGSNYSIGEIDEVIADNVIQALYLSR